MGEKIAKFVWMLVDLYDLAWMIFFEAVGKVVRWLI